MSIVGSFFNNNIRSLTMDDRILLIVLFISRGVKPAWF